MYHILPYTKQKAKEIGVTVKPSENPKKKIDVFKNGKKIASVGATGYNDYPTYKEQNGKAFADKRRELYHMRHKNEGLPGKLAKKLLW